MSIWQLFFCYAAYGRFSLQVHSFDAESHLTPGDDFYVTAPDTACGQINVGPDVEMLRHYRETEVHENASRHPEKYAMLSDAKISKQASMQHG